MPGKTWTVLIYANGNNDIEPEIYRGIRAVRDEPAPENVKIIVQLARASRRLVEIFRGRAVHQSEDPWDGVRRYIAGQTGLVQVADLGHVNMAAPNTLADFLIWGVTNYPADYIMVILSGHGAGFTGILTDYTQSCPVMMSMKGLTGAFRQCWRKTGRQCTALVIDACFMNMIEVWYELALTPTRPVRFLLTPRSDASMECLPYHLIIRELGADRKGRISARKSLTDIVTVVNGADKISSDVLAVDLSAENFIRLKNIIDELSGSILTNNRKFAKMLRGDYLQSPHYPLMNVLELTDKLTAIRAGVSASDNLLPAILDKIILGPPHAATSERNNLDVNIFLPATPDLYACYASDYESLLFTVGNRWPQVLRGGEPTDYAGVFRSKTEQEMLPPSVPMSLSSVACSLQTQFPHLSIEQALRILQELGWQIES